MGNGTFSFISSFVLCVCVALCLYMLVHKHFGSDVWFCVTTQLGGGEHQRLCAGGDTGIISHGLSHKFECI